MFPPKQKTSGKTSPPHQIEQTIQHLEPVMTQQMAKASLGFVSLKYKYFNETNPEET